MERKPEIERRINEVLESISNIKRAEPKPFFFTRLEARMLREERNVWEKMTRMVSRPSIALLSLTLVVLLNTLVVINGFPTFSEEPEISDVATVEDLHSTTFYDIENNQP